MDSSAQFPPPSCHPGTRLKIADRLYHWLDDPQRRWNMMWLHGPVGTGKSAVAQTFAEHCAERGRLGASFFFSRPNERNKPDTVIPSLVYQLAVCLPHYKFLVAVQLAHDPEPFRKTRRAQFKKLIIDPFSQLQTQRRERIQEPFLIILDGLDECKGENAQRDIIEMIGEVVRQKHDFPLVWLICSRPEAYLKYLFSKADYTVSCGREELVIDANSIADVDLYLQDGLAGIKDHFWDATPPIWPSDEQFTELSRKASGHFAFASTALRYVGDLSYAAPTARPSTLLSFLSGVRIGTSNPLEALDTLYTRILRDVPAEILLVVKRVLGFSMYLSFGAQFPCNFLSIDQVTFYAAFRKLHSVIDVPSPDAPPKTHLGFHHASFEDFLRDPRRSGQFSIVRADIMSEYAKLCLSWYETDMTLFHTTDGWEFDASHKHGILPGLKWVSDDSSADISVAIAVEAEGWCWWAFFGALEQERDEPLLSQIQHFDFRYIRRDTLGEDWVDFVNKLWKLEASSGIVRTEPRSQADLQLLEYMGAMIGPQLGYRAVTFPLELESNRAGGEYFLIGRGLKAIVCWTTGREDDPRLGVLNCDEVPSEERINAYRALLVEGEDHDELIQCN